MLIAAAALSAPTAMPSRTWSGVERIVVSCRVEPGTRVAEADLCDAFLTEAARNSPYPVTLADSGARRDSTVAALDVHVRQADGGGLLLELTLSRPAPTDDAQAARRGPATVYRATPSGGIDWAAVSVALDRALPWRAMFRRRGPLDRVRQYS